jgi:hypothetical protein
MKLWLVTVIDKELAGEPHIGVVIVEGNVAAAVRAVEDLERACMDGGRRRCVGSYREIIRGKQYRAKALIRTG